MHLCAFADKRGSLGAPRRSTSGRHCVILGHSDLARRYVGALFGLKKCVMAGAIVGPAPCIAGFALILCFFQTSTKSRHAYCFSQVGILDWTIDVRESMGFSLSAIQRNAIRREFRCFKHLIFHIKSIPERLGGLDVPNV